MATVWEAEDEVLTRPVAVKVLHAHLAADESFVTRFRAEAISAARLAHPSIVSIYDTWSEDGVEAIVMELVRGTTLRHLLDQRGPLEPAEAVTIANHIVAALEAAHRGGIVHRDIKPANVLLSTDGRVLVTDFGIAKAVEGADLTTERTMLGTAKYLAPEQVDGAAVDGRTDLYALGVVLYEMLCGQVPFRADTEAATALARLHRLPDPPGEHRPGLSRSLETIVMRCLAREPGDRYADAAAVLSALATADTNLEPVQRAPVPTRLPTGAAVDGDRAPVAVGPAATGAAASVEPSPRVPAPGGPATVGARRVPSGRLVLAGLVVIALGVAGILAFGVLDRETVADQGPPQPVAIVAAAAFDPLGTPKGEEHNDQVGLSIDADPSTAWTTETYRSGSLGKAGVGLSFRLEGSPTVGSVTVQTPSPGWSASVYAIDDDPGADLASWGEPVGGLETVARGRAVFRFGPRPAGAVLLWITGLGGDRRVVVSEVVITDA